VATAMLAILLAVVICGPMIAWYRTGVVLRRTSALWTLCLAACGTPNKPEAPPSAPTAPAASVAPDASTTVAEAPKAEPEPEPGPGPREKDGETDPASALATAKKESKPAFLVFCAKWVAACGELSHVLADSAVKKTLDERYVVARVDVSNEDDPATRERMKKFNVKGLPFMIVVDRKGKEVAREQGYLDSSRIAKLLDKAK
jgi:thiol:disulfide interchange protein